MKTKPVKKKPVKKKTRPTVIDLGPSAPPARPPAGKSLQWTTLTVGLKGTLPIVPTRVEAATGDWVVWIINNESGRTLTLGLKNFKRRSDGKSLKPVQFLHARVTIASRGVGVLVGRIVHAVTDPKGAGEAFHYTIEVRGPGAIDYDPDLEIRPPALDN